MRYGIKLIGPAVWGGLGPELAVSGPNVGCNVLDAVHVSGTIATAVYAAREEHIPAISFSGATFGNLPWNVSPVPRHSTVYGKLGAILVNKLVEGGAPYLPRYTWLNVNFPEVTSDKCRKVKEFKWVLSRTDPVAHDHSKADVLHCGRKRLPMEQTVITHDGCHIAVTVVDARTKKTASVKKQALVLSRLHDMFTCLQWPEGSQKDEEGQEGCWTAKRT